MGKLAQPLPRTFFQQPVQVVAPALLGTFLTIRQKSGLTARYTITEVEAYDGPDDLACHASRGRTARTEVMFSKGGVFYVYLIYGMYHMLNIVTDKRDYPSAVLIRGVESINGPGRLTRNLNIDKTLHGLQVHPDSNVWIEAENKTIPSILIQKTPRIGVSYAGEWAMKPLRYILNMS